MSEFERGQGALCVKLVGGKLTYVSRALWPAFSRLALYDARPIALSAAALSLRELVAEHGSVRVDRLQLEHIDKRELAAAARELEKNLLVHAASVHTNAGHHAKVLSSWSEWSRSSGTTPSKGSLEEARRDLLLALGRLTKGSVREALVPFLSR